MANTPVIGVLGGGQLARMLLEAAGPLGLQVAVLDEEGSSARQISQNALNVTGSFKDPEKIRELARNCDVLTIEVEHVDTHVLEEVATKGVTTADGRLKKVPVHPSWETIRLIQDKYLQKEHFRANGLPVAPQVAISGPVLDALPGIAAKFGCPFMLKSRKESYDGRGNFTVRGPDDFQAAADAMGKLSLYAEKWVPFQKELAVIVVRSEDDAGNLRAVHAYPAVETVHEESICTKVFYPPRQVPADLCQQASNLAADVVRTLKGRGIFAVEMFVTKDGSLTVNEVAPRPHNSGHLFIEAMPYMSQYKAHLYSVLDLLPSNIKLQPRVASAIMLNILGGAQADSHHAVVDMAHGTFSDDMDVFLHLYGKGSKPSRKIGHITVASYDKAVDLAGLAAPLVKGIDTMRQDRLDAASSMLRPSAPSQPAASSSSRNTKSPLVVITMGSDSDLGVLKGAFEILEQFRVPYDFTITSAHRTPHRMVELGKSAAGRGIRVLIAAAGGAAHLPGMLASETTVPVIGVPVKATHLDGHDSLLSIVQMPRGCPVATVGINNSTNAALLAVKILGASDPAYQQAMAAYMQNMSKEVEAKAAKLEEIGWAKYLEK
jgi:phosphoribosylaminoimidazole carboxylase